MSNSVTKSVPALWSGPIVLWCQHMRAEGLSSETIRTRGDHLRRASRALGGSPWQVGEDALIGWVAGCQWGRETRRSVYASLRGFFGWGVDRGHVDMSVAGCLPSVAAESPCPRPTPEPIYRAAVAGADGRTRLILRIAAQIGLRRAEIAQIHARDLSPDLLGYSLRVHGKGGKQRDILLPVPLGLEIARAVEVGGGWAFPGDDGGHLSPRYVGTLASRALPPGWTLHTLRHRFGTVAYAAERDLVAVSELLGHASVATTQRYVRAPDGAKRRAIEHAAA